MKSIIFATMAVLARAGHDAPSPNASEGPGPKSNLGKDGSGNIQVMGHPTREYGGQYIQADNWNN